MTIVPDGAALCPVDAPCHNGRASKCRCQGRRWYVPDSLAVFRAEEERALALLSHRSLARFYRERSDRPYLDGPRIVALANYHASMALLELLDGDA